MSDTDKKVDKEKKKKLNEKADYYAKLASDLQIQIFCINGLFKLCVDNSEGKGSDGVVWDNYSSKKTKTVKTFSLSYIEYTTNKTDLNTRHTKAIELSESYSKQAAAISIDD